MSSRLIANASKHDTRLDTELQHAASTASSTIVQWSLHKTLYKTKAFCPYMSLADSSWIPVWCADGTHFNCAKQWTTLERVWERSVYATCNETNLLISLKRRALLRSAPGIIALRCHRISRLEPAKLHI